MGAVIMLFTIVDALCILVTGSSLATVFFGSGSPITDALIEVIPGMSPIEFIIVNLISLIILSTIAVICIYYAFPVRCECDMKEGYQR